MLADALTCCGCAVCAAVCPVHAVKMAEDREGFRYPHVDNTLCIGCGLCEEKCPVLNNTGLAEHCREIYFGYFRDSKKVLESSSGGFLTALAEKVIGEGGCVFGAYWNRDFSHAIYKMAETIEELAPLRGSKYVMSEPDVHTYETLKKELESGRTVLYTGCPCEIGAVKAYLGRDYDNLLTGEVICQGGTTPLALQAYVRETERARHAKICSMNMRAKMGKWTPFYMHLELEKEGNAGPLEDCYIPLSQTSYDAAFLNVKRQSCYRCSYKAAHSAADYTAGDHYGISPGDEQFNEAGVSVIFVHTQKGADYLRGMDFLLFPETYERAAGIQHCLGNCIAESELRNDFMRIMLSDSLAAASDYVRSKKSNTFASLIEGAGSKLPSERFRYVIWGVGKYFEVTYENLRRYYPQAELVGIVDKYKTGERYGVKISTPDELADIPLDHVFITTVMGKADAVAKMTELYGDAASEKYTLSMM